MRVLGVIPARGGSKGIPRKNIRALKGKPLLAYTAEAALSARRLSRVVLSTEEEEIAEIGRSYGLDVPFWRPSGLAADETPTLPVLQHAVACLEAVGDCYEAVCLLQPTNPFRRPEDIDRCIELLEQSGVDGVITVLPVPAEHNPHWVYFRDSDGLLHLSTGEKEPIPRRQSLPPAFHRDGSVYVVRRDVLMEGNSIYGQRLLGYPLVSCETVNLDTLEDWDRAEAMLDGLHESVR